MENNFLSILNCTCSADLPTQFTFDNVNNGNIVDLVLASNNFISDINNISYKRFYTDIGHNPFITSLECSTVIKEVGVFILPPL